MKHDPDVGQQVNGTILAVTDEWVWVDLGSVSEGRVSADVFRDKAGAVTAKVSDAIDLIVTGKDSETGALILQKGMHEAIGEQLAERTMREKMFIACRNCQQVTKHEVVAKHTVRGSCALRGFFRGFDHNCLDHPEDWDDLDELISWEDTYEMLACLGCEAAMLRHTRRYSKLLGNEENCYPPFTIRPIPEWHWKLPSRIRTLLEEIYSALHAGSRTLALMGTRAVLDILMLDQLGDSGSFRKKMDVLEKDGYVGREQRKQLEAALDAGHAATHRAFAPNQEQFNNVISIVENILESIYVLKYSAEQLRRSTPQRQTVEEPLNLPLHRTPTAPSRGRRR